MQQQPYHTNARRNWRRLRARLSLPGLLARFDEDRVLAVAASVNGALSILSLGLLAWLTQLPLLFPALGPTAFILYSAPCSRPAAPRSVVLGHLVGMMAGLAGSTAVATVTGSAIGLSSGPAAVISATLGLALCCVLLVRLDCPHAPSCATCLLIALGGVAGTGELLTMAAAIILITGQAAVVHRVAGLPTALWCPIERPEEVV